MSIDNRESDYYSFVIPAWAVCLIENGIGGGETEEEIKAVDKFLANLPDIGDGDYIGFEYGEESYFSHSNDVDSLGNDCVDAKLHFWKGE